MMRMGLLAALTPLTAWATPMIAVTGQCQKEVAPDRVAIVMTAQAQDKDPSKATKQASTMYERARAEVKKLNLKDIRLETAQYSVNPDWDYSSQRQVLKGYTARVSLKVETSETNKIGDVLQLAARQGLQDISSPTTFLSPELHRKEYENCMEEAVKNARVKADKIARAGGLNLGTVIAIEEFKDGPRPLPEVMHAVRNKEVMESAAPAIGFEVRPETVSVTIYAKYGVK